MFRMVTRRIKALLAWAIAAVVVGLIGLGLFVAISAL